MRKWAMAAAWLVIAVAGLVLVGGWIFGIEVLKNIVPGAVQMKSLTAVGLALAGASLLLLIDPGITGGRGMLGRLCAFLLIVIGGSILAEYTLGWDPGFDEFPFIDVVGRSDAIAYPGRPAPTTAVCFVLVGLSLLTLDYRPASRWRFSELASVPVVVVATASLIGYLYEIPEFYGPSSAAKMAVHTATCFLLVGIALIIARPRGRLLTLATTTAPGGVMARRLMPFVVLMPLLLGWSRLELGDAGVFGDRVGTWWLTASTIAVFLLVLGRAANRMNQLDIARVKLEGELYVLANHDQLTGLFNRHRFVEELAQHARRTRRVGGSTALIAVDLDRLKEVNDGLGHVAGDTLIEGVGKAIGLRARTTDTAARLGGDEFVILLPAGTLEGATTAAEALLDEIRAVMPRVGEASVSSAASLGIAYSESALPDDGQELLADADIAMYDAKRSGGDCVAVFKLKTPALVVK